MKPNPQGYGVIGELKPVKPNSDGVGKLVSVVVSVVDPLTSNPLLHMQLRMEPMAGIEPATDGLRNRCSTAELHWLTGWLLRPYQVSILQDSSIILWPTKTRSKDFRCCQINCEKSEL